MLRAEIQRLLPVRLSHRLRLIQWALPAAIALVAVVYQFGPARLVHDRFGDWSHYSLEVLFYATAGPASIWLTLRVVRTWVEQKEGAEEEVRRLNEVLQLRVEQRTAELRQKADDLAAANARLQELDHLKSEFVSLVSHELRAPLTNVQGALELIEGECPALVPACGRMVGIIKEQLGRLHRLVEGVLDISRIEAGRLQLDLRPLDVGAIVERVLEDFTPRSPLRRLRYARPAAGPVVRADDDRLYEIIGNLVDNAVKYSPPDSEIAVSVEAAGDNAVVSVRDRGPGIPSAEVDRIFEKFHRIDDGDARETYGHGLGLYLSRRLVEAMGGRIWVETQPGSGATFRFSLPLARAPGSQVSDAGPYPGD